MKKLLLVCVMLLTVIGMKAEDSAIELLNTTPKNGEKYSVNEANGNVVFTFNRGVTIDKAWIVPAEGNKIAITNSWDSFILQYYYYCGIANQMKQLLSDGIIKAGETFSIELEGIKDKENPSIIFGTDGKVSISLVATRLPATLVSVSKEDGTDLKSYYKPGDEEGIITFTFSEPVTCQSAKIIYGDVEAGTYGHQDVPFTITEEKVLANLQGIHMEPEALNGATAITLQLGTLQAVSDESIVEGNIPGSPGRVGMHYTIKKGASEEIYGGFEGDIDKDDHLSCWISGKITFDAVRFSYNLKNKPTVIDISSDQFTITDDPENEGAITFTVPLQYFTFDAGDVIVELVNANDLAGSSVEINETFSSKGRTAANSTCLGITPTPGTLSAFPQQFTFVFNDAVTVESGTIINGEMEMQLIVGANIIVDNNKVTITNFRGSFIGDVSFKLQVKDSKEAYITYGNTENYVIAEYSIPSNTLVCTSSDPAPGKVTSLHVITLTFTSPDKSIVGGFDPEKKATLTDESGNVVATGTFDYADFAYPMNAILTLDKEITTAGVYTLTIPEAAVYNDRFDDAEEDLGVANGAIYNPEKTIIYSLGEITPTTCTVTPAPGEYKLLPSQYVFTFSRNVTIEMAKMKNDNTDRLGEDILSNVNVDNNIVTITLPEGSTSNYTFLNFMLEAIDITGEAVTLGMAEGYVVVDYTTPVAANTYECTKITPEEGEVSSLKVFTLTFTNSANERATVGGFDTSKEIVLKDSQGSIATTGTIDLTDGDNWAEAIVTLSEEINTDGTYTLIIPEGTVYDDQFDPYADDFGVSFGAIYNPELTFTYQVKTTGIENATIDELTGEVSVYNTQGIFIRKADISVALKDLPKGIYIVNGKKIAVY